MTTEPLRDGAEELPDTTVMLDGTTAGVAALRDKLADALTPGFQAELDPEEAEHAGAFHEAALNEEDAAESAVDLAAALEELGVYPRSSNLQEGG